MDLAAKNSKTGQGALVAPALDIPHDPPVLHPLRVGVLIIMLVTTYILSLLVGGSVGAAIESVLLETSSSGKTCTVSAGGSESIDDAPAILEAFNECGQNGNVIFSNTTYYVNSVMNISGLQNCQVDIYGTLLVCNSLLLSYRAEKEAYILLINIVEHRYRLLAQSFTPCWLPESVNGVDHRWRWCYC
jgi:hypothetical protein